MSALVGSICVECGKSLLGNEPDDSTLCFYCLPDEDPEGDCFVIEVSA